LLLYVLSICLQEWARIALQSQYLENVTELSAKTMYCPNYSEIAKFWRLSLSVAVPIVELVRHKGLTCAWVTTLVGIVSHRIGHAS
jgi:hypothetical protein